MSDADAALSLYYTMLVLLGVPWLAGASRGFFSGVAWERLIYLAVPILVIHVVVVPGYLASWPYQWAVMALHSMVAMPVAVALYLTLLREWDALERKPGSRVAFVVVWSAGVAAIAAAAPGLTESALVVGLMAISAAVAPRAEMEIA